MARKKKPKVQRKAVTPECTIEEGQYKYLTFGERCEKYGVEKAKKSEKNAFKNGRKWYKIKFAIPLPDKNVDLLSHYMEVLNE